MISNLDDKNVKLGDSVVIVWKKTNGSAVGASEGVVVGKTGDNVSGEYLVIDRSTYQDSLKDILFSLGIMDLNVIPFSEILSASKAEVRKRPHNLDENIKFKMEIDYESNVDFVTTRETMSKRSDCKVVSNQGLSDAVYQIIIKEIDSIQDATIQLTATGYIQVYCKPKQLEHCIEWIKISFVLLPEQKHLVLIPTNFMFTVHDNFKTPAYPTDEVIGRLGKTEGNQPIILPIGWVNQFFSEYNSNPLKPLFPNTEIIESLVLQTTKKRKKEHSSHEGFSTDSLLKATIAFPQDQEPATRYIGASPPILRIEGLAASSKIRKELIQFWLNSRTPPWSWMQFGEWEGKTIIRDLVINTKTGAYTLDVSKYYDNDFFDTKLKK